MPCINWIKSIAKGMAGSQYGRDLESYIASKKPKSLAEVERYTLEYERKIAEQTFKF